MASKTMKTKVEIDRRHQCFSQQGYHNIRVSPNWKRKSTPRSRPQKSSRSLHNRHSAQFVHRPGYNHAQCSLRASVVELVIHQRIIDPLVFRIAGVPVMISCTRKRVVETRRDFIFVDPGSRQAVLRSAIARRSAGHRLSAQANGTVIVGGAYDCGRGRSACTG